MARIPEAEIERIKREVSLERLVEASGIALKRTGKVHVYRVAAVGVDSTAVPRGVPDRR